MRFALKINQHQLEWPEILSRYQYGEKAGFDTALMFDHFKAMEGDPLGPCMEAYTLLGAIAAETQTIRLGALATGVTFRHPSVLAAQAVTLDRISGGRAELPLGAAWNEAEHRPLGLEFPSNRERVERLEEAVQMIRLLMTADDVSFRGRHYCLEGATYRPRPVQEPRVPIWVAANGSRLTIPLAAREATCGTALRSSTTFPRRSGSSGSIWRRRAGSPRASPWRPIFPPGAHPRSWKRASRLSAVSFSRCWSWPGPRRGIPGWTVWPKCC